MAVAPISKNVQFTRGSLVYRLTIRFALLVTLTTMVVLVVGGWLLNRQAMHSLEILQAMEADELAGLLGTKQLSPEKIRSRVSNHADGDYALYFIQVTDAQGKLLFKSASLGEAFIPDSDGGGTNQAFWMANVEGVGSMRVLEKNSGPWRIVVGSALGPVRHLLNEYIRVCVLLVLVTMLLSMLSGYAFSRMMVAPIKAIEETARRISADNLSERIVVPKGHAELAALADLLNQAFNRIESSFAQVRRFSADASHELKTPLALVRLGAEKLRPRLAGDPQADALLADLLEEADHMQRIIDSLLFIAKAEGGAFTLERTSCDMQSFVADFAEDARVLADDRGVRFELAHSEAGGALVNRQMLRQLLLNLASNAITATPKGGLITLASEATEKGWRLTLADEGSGLPPEVIERIFERFTRHQPSASAGGSGLGLAICRSIAGLHGGTIRAENRTDRSGLKVVFEC